MLLRSTWRSMVGFLPWFPLVLAASCSGADEPTASDTPGNTASSGRETIRVAREGGQTGMEGSCLAVPEPPAFSEADVRTLIEGTHRTSLAYRSEQRLPGASLDDVMGLPMTVEVELQGEATRLDPAEGEGCNLRIQQDVELTVSFDEPPLDLVIETTAFAFSSSFAVVQRELERDVSEALGLPSTGITLSLAFNENGMQGSFDPNDGCGSAVFPADAHCPDWTRIEVDIERERDGFRPSDALSVFDDLGEVPLRWSDGGETTLSVSLVEPPEWACSGEWVQTYRPETLELPLVVRMVTADGRLDAELPAELTLEVATQASAEESMSGSAGEVESLRISASYLGTAGASDETGDTGFHVNVWKDADAATAEGFVLTLEHGAPGLTPPLDATIDAAPSSCVVFGAAAAPEDG